MAQKQVRRGAVYIFRPVFGDQVYAHLPARDGDRVRVVTLGCGRPAYPFRHVENVTTGEVGMVSVHSLVRR